MIYNTKRQTILFLIIQLVLYAGFLTIDLTGGSIVASNGIKFLIIILCFCYALFFGKGADKSILFAMRSALFFTLVSDLFILILDYYYYGVLTFIFAQQLYGIRISMDKYHVDREEEQKQLRQSFLIRLAIQAALLAGICIVLFTQGMILDELLIASLFYFICITTNTVRAIFAIIRNPGNRELLLFTIGLVLFLLCDINVGLFNIARYIHLPDNLSDVVYSMSAILMWTFYAPSQTLIALSTKQRMQETLSL